MSLTSHLKDISSPVRQFIHSQFPNNRAVVRDAKDVLVAATTTRPSSPVPYSTIGMALDYRLRYYFSITPSEALVAAKGADQLISAQRELFWLAAEFFESLKVALDELQPVRQRLDAQHESRLAQYCYVLALFEQLYRAGLDIRSPLLVPIPADSVEALLAIPQPAAIDDLCTLSWVFYDGFTDLINGAREIVLNPTFDGSRDVGGADADVILDGCLLEFKTSVKPKLDPFALYQLLGYVLLDYSDRYQIQGMGVYMARQGVLLRWPLTELLRTMAGAPSPDLADIRGRFRQIAG
jgi:hypothetical protein